MNTKIRFICLCKMSPLNVWLHECMHRPTAVIYSHLCTFLAFPCRPVSESDFVQPRRGQAQIRGMPITHVHILMSSAVWETGSWTDLLRYLKSTHTSTIVDIKSENNWSVIVQRQLSSDNCVHPGPWAMAPHTSWLLESHRLWPLPAPTYR
jgi:hypothetical protein